MEAVPTCVSDLRKPPLDQTSILTAPLLTVLWKLLSLGLIIIVCLELYSGLLESWDHLCVIKS